MPLHKLQIVESCLDDRCLIFGECKCKSLALFVVNWKSGDFRMGFCTAALSYN